jgi:hypothetical protein
MHRAIVCLVVIAAACARRVEPPPAHAIDADATFVAHRIHGGYAIDRPGTGAGEIRAVGRLGSSGPAFAVRDAGAVRATLWLVAPATVSARTDAASPGLSIAPSWEEQAVRLTLRSTDGTWYRTDVLSRVDGRTGTPVLRRGLATTLDARGTYRALVREDGGAAVGWIEVRVPSPDEPRLVQGALPASEPVMGPALTVAIDSEVDWIEDHALDVYRGTSGGRDHGGSNR